MSDNNDYQDNTFNLYQAYSYTLLLQVELHSFSYSVVYQNRLLVSARNCELSELADPKQLNDLLSATYKKVIIGLSATGFTLVPVSLFSEQHVAGFARFLDVKDHEKVLAQPLDAQNIIVYKTDENLVSAVERFNLDNAVYTSKGWIKAISKSSPPNNSLYIEVGDDTLQFLNYKDGGLRFYNSFEFKNEDELAYFAAFVADELNLSPRDTTIVLSGNVSKDDEKMARLAEFFGKVELNNLHVLEIPGQIAAHKILALAALSLCGSSEEL